MRAAILGVWAGDELPALRQLVAASTRITHTDPAAEDGAIAVAVAAAYAAAAAPSTVISPERFLLTLRSALRPGSPLLPLIEQVVAAVSEGSSLDQYLSNRGLQHGVSGYINHTVPAALFCWLRWPRDYRRAVEAVVLAGGDTDSTGAIVGALVGAAVGVEGIPREWLDGLCEWPRSVRWMRRLAHRLAVAKAGKSAARPLPLFWPGLLLRNVFFLIVVLIHGVRRILPPY
jgi:ADP-ribosylglycohydrolase